MNIRRIEYDKGHRTRGLGSVYILKRKTCLDVPIDGIGICVDIYLEGSGKMILFETGEYDGFNIKEEHRFLEFMFFNVTLPSEWEYRTSMILADDYNNGLFDNIFTTARNKVNNITQTRTLGNVAIDTKATKSRM